MLFDFLLLFSVVSAIIIPIALLNAMKAIHKNEDTKVQAAVLCIGSLVIVGTILYAFHLIFSII